ncbi:hypothetical protein [Chryseobacterium oranimense]|nr:hypothetical protein [Chryseobacterium oranimense]
MKNQRTDMGLKNKNTCRVIRMHCIIGVFDAYTKLKLNQSLLNNERGPKENERREFFSMLFNFNFSPLPDNDELTNDIIELHKSMENYLVESEQLGISRKLMESLISSLENDGQFAWLKCYHFMYRRLIGYYVMYTIKEISLNTLKNLSINIITGIDPFPKVNIRRMFQILKMVEDQYYTINLKQEIRSLKNKFSKIENINFTYEIKGVHR